MSGSEHHSPLRQADAPPPFVAAAGGSARACHDYFNGAEPVDPVAGYWERDTSWFEANVLPDFLEAKDRLGFGGRVLDIGCAYGYSTCRYAAHFDSVVGIDFVERRIAGANARNARPNVRYAIANVTADDLTGIAAGIAFESGVTSAEFQHLHADDRAEALANVTRVIKPGGIKRNVCGASRSTFIHSALAIYAMPFTVYLGFTGSNAWIVALEQVTP
jgi:SAM-dependent methyltransferase